MADTTHSRKLAAILAADVAGYSRLMSADESATVGALNEGRAVFRERIAAHDGQLIDTAGDSVLATFPSVVEAVQCAVEVQKTLKDKNESVPEERRMRFRIGVNLGDVIEQADGTIYGDGVNVAARLESLAEPGEVAISEDAHRQVMRKLGLGFQDIGEHDVKNIPEPVHAYRVLPEGAEILTRPTTSCKPSTVRRVSLIVGAAAIVLVIAGVAAWQFSQSPTSDPASAPSAARELSEGPSIAVLPFQNRSDDVGQDYFVDGMTEAIITGLSRVPELLVISRSSSFTYKGRTVRADDVGRELGVRYVMEGSVQRAGDQVRISAQLIDTATDGNVWVDQIDGALIDVFALQDEVTRKIVAALELTLGQGEAQETAPLTANMDAYDLYLQATDKAYVITPASNIEAGALYEAAIALDADFAAAYAGLAWVRLRAWVLQWDANPENIDRAFELAQKAVTLDPDLAVAHATLSDVFLWKKQYDAALDAGLKAIEIDPNSIEAHRSLSSLYIFSGRPEDAIVEIEQAMRRNPTQPWLYQWSLGHARLLLNDLDGAIEALETSIQGNPNFLPSHAYLGVAYHERGDKAQALAAVDRATALSPQLTIASVAERLPYKDSTVLNRLVTAWHALGLK